MKMDDAIVEFGFDCEGTKTMSVRRYRLRIIRTKMRYLIQRKFCIHT